MKRTSLFFALMMVFVGAISLSSCKKSDDASPTATKVDSSLYLRLGKEQAITAVVDKFLANVVGDNRINGKFAATVADSYRTTLLRNNLIDQICAGSGGPCYYKGKSMLESHRGMNITEAEFNALVEDLVAALNFYNVRSKEQNDLLAILGPMKSDIVGR